MLSRKQVLPESIKDKIDVEKWIDSELLKPENAEILRTFGTLCLVCYNMPINGHRLADYREVCDTAQKYRDVGWEVEFDTHDRFINILFS